MTARTFAFRAFCPFARSIFIDSCFRALEPCYVSILFCQASFFFQNTFSSSFPYLFDFVRTHTFEFLKRFVLAIPSLVLIPTNLNSVHLRSCFYSWMFLFAFWAFSSCWTFVPGLSHFCFLTFSCLQTLHAVAFFSFLHILQHCRGSYCYCLPSPHDGLWSFLFFVLLCLCFSAHLYFLIFARYTFKFRCIFSWKKTYSLLSRTSKLLWSCMYAFFCVLHIFANSFAKKDLWIIASMYNLSIVKDPRATCRNEFSVQFEYQLLFHNLLNVCRINFSTTIMNNIVIWIFTTIQG